MGRRQRPPDHVLIWFGVANNDLPPFFVSASALSRPAEPEPERIGYYVMFALRKLVVYVLAGSPRYGDVLRQALGLSEPARLAIDALVPIWPVPDGEVRWPPPRALQTADIEKLTAARVTWADDYPAA